MNSPEQIKGVVFDLGGVVIDWNPMYLYSKVFDGDITKAANFLQTICTNAWNGEQDAGRGLIQATEERIALFPEWEQEIRAYYGRWIEMIGGPMPGTLELMRDLQAAGYRLFALSNWASETFGRVRYSFPALAMFEHIVLSGEYGMIKPDPRFYKIALDCFGMDPASLIFTDDSPVNVEGAIRCGLPAVLFTGADQLRADLIARGVKISASS